MRRKLTITIDEKILEEAKLKSRRSGLPLSRIIESALCYYVSPRVYCFVCGHSFSIKSSEPCPRCGWYRCPSCGACACSLGDEGARVAFYMRKTLIEIFHSTEI